MTQTKEESFFLKREKQKKIISLALKFQTNKEATAHSAQRVLGLRASTIPLVTYAKHKMRPLHSWFLVSFDSMKEHRERTTSNNGIGEATEMVAGQKQSTDGHVVQISTTF